MNKHAYFRLGIYIRVCRGMGNTKAPDKAIVAAIDVGITHSGYAYADKKEFKIENNSNITINKWTGSRVQHQWDKAPSVALFDPNKKFHSFGYSAGSMYMEEIKMG